MIKIIRTPTKVAGRIMPEEKSYLMHTLKELGSVRFVGTFDQVKQQIAATIAMAEGG